MTKEIKKLNILNKGLVPPHFYKSGAGFVILFAVTLAAIVLAIAVGVTNIALKEIKFTTSAKDSNNAFYAADTTIEYVLFKDKPLSGLCVPQAGQTCSQSFTISGLGSAGQSCATAVVTKDNTINPPFIKTTIISKGYNKGDSSCNSTNPDRIEREIRTTY